MEGRSGSLGQVLFSSRLSGGRVQLRDEIVNGGERCVAVQCSRDVLQQMSAAEHWGMALYAHPLLRPAVLFHHFVAVHSVDEAGGRGGGLRVQFLESQRGDEALHLKIRSVMRK